MNEGLLLNKFAEDFASVAPAVNTGAKYD